MSITFVSRRTGEDEGCPRRGAAARSLQRSRLTFAPSTLAPGSWWLPGVTPSFGHCRSNHIIEPAKVKRTATGGAQTSEGIFILQIFQKSEKSRSACHQGRPLSVPFELSENKIELR